MELKDVLHLHLGCELLCGDERLILNGRNLYNTLKHDWKPILRPLSDITEEEAIEVTKPIVVYGENAFGKIVVSLGESRLEKYLPQDETFFTPKQFRYLLSKHFDLFSLIENNLAIDKNDFEQILRRTAEQTLSKFKTPYDAGWDCAIHGANNFNSHYGWFNTKERMEEWSRGNNDAKQKSHQQHY